MDFRKLLIESLDGNTDVHIHLSNDSCLHLYEAHNLRGRGCTVRDSQRIHESIQYDLTPTEEQVTKIKDTLIEMNLYNQAIEKLTE
ncbi:MAG: hypothetical protein ISR90_07080 [Candidatus Marinimicrobia bacterium]|nr:hypothetical protein [Candidatus Neomarinimicrobiota bacterium]